MPSTQAIARLQARLPVKQGVRDARTDELLREIALKGENDAWRRWALAGLHTGPEATADERER
jgi:hypothetical protein